MSEIAKRSDTIQIESRGFVSPALCQICSQVTGQMEGIFSRSDFKVHKHSLISLEEEEKKEKK